VSAATEPKTPQVDAANDSESSSGGTSQTAESSHATIAGTAGWAFVGGGEHPAVVLDAAGTRLFVLHGTSSDYLAGALQGQPIIVGQPQGKAFGWPGVTHFYPKATATVSALTRATGRIPPLLFVRFRKLVGY
jgi:hypothetical protein